MTVWIEITDVLDRLAGSGRPSDDQRIVHELCAAMAREGAGAVGFVRRAGGPRDFRVVAWQSVESAYEEATSREGGPGAPARETASRNGSLLSAVARGEMAVAAHLGAALRGAALRGAARLAGRRRRAGGGGNPRLEARAGDVFLAFGASWSVGDYAETARWLRDELRVTFGCLIHDLVPMRHPEWCDGGTVRTFRSWHENVLPLADIVFTLSRATASDVEAYLDARQIDVPGGVVPVSAGTVSALTRVKPAARRIVDEPYVLFVSTIEARKNHVLLFHVWKKLLAEHAREEVPTLVFAGKEGWLVADFMRQMENTDWLGGKIRFIREPTDSALRRLYDDCLFTVFPSFFEGWGLPVTESLALGKPCVASRSSSIPEAGGEWARYFSPYDVGDAARVIGDALSDPAALARRAEEIRAGFRPAPWDESARRMLEAIGRV